LQEVERLTSRESQCFAEVGLSQLRQSEAIRRARHRRLKTQLKAMMRVNGVGESGVTQTERPVSTYPSPSMASS
jgi:hypothetical protein